MNIHELIKSYEEMTLEELTVEEVLDDLRAKYFRDTIDFR